MKIVMVVAILAALFGGCAPKETSQDKAASSCTITKVGNIGTIKCPDGSIGTIVDGQPGPAGPTGPQGQPGMPGVNGSTITTVQLCPGYTVSYPSSFPEFALRIGTQLLAVYWDGHQAFLAVIPPGRYQSTSPQWCTFTVNADGSITN